MIQTEYELETKIQVNRADFYRLLDQGVILDSIDQLNVYFDHKSKLSDQASTFRVRLFNRGTPPKMTLKIPVSNEQEGVRKCLEIEEQLDEKQDYFRLKRIPTRELPEEFAHHLLQLGIEHIERLGTMRTHRHMLRLSGATVEADEVRLPGGEMFFEVEFESSDSHKHREVRRLISFLSTSASPSHVSKYERFTASLKASPLLRQRQRREDR